MLGHAPCIASPKLRTIVLQYLKIEWANSIHVQDWSYMSGCHTKDNVWNDKTPLQKFLVDPRENLNFAVKKDV